MLKPTGDGPQPGGDKSLGELATQLVDDAKAYARAEVDLAKAIADDKLQSLRLSAILFGVAALVAIAAVTTLSVAIFIALAMQIGPIWSGLVTFLVAGAIAAAIGWLALQKFKDAL